MQGKIGFLLLNIFVGTGDPQTYIFATEYFQMNLFSRLYTNVLEYFLSHYCV